MDEVRQTPDDETRRRVVLRPEHPPLHLSSATVSTLTERVGSCTRSFLATALADLKAETGFDLHIAYENEFALFGEDIRWAAPFSLDAVRRIAPFADLCVAALIDAGLSIRDLRAGVWRRAIRDHLRACGGSRGRGPSRPHSRGRARAARQCGLRATFSPKPAPDAVGNAATFI